MLLSLRFTTVFSHTTSSATRRSWTRALFSKQRNLNMSSSNTPPTPTRNGSNNDDALRFPVSPIPPNPLGKGRHIRTAAALVIGDEILNGKTLDRNSNFFARYCFEHGLQLKRVEVIPDDESEIIEASRRMVKKYDFVITTGGIGPTHDDITYGSLAKSFNQPLVHHAETIRRMEALNRNRQLFSYSNEKQREAARRMALFPRDAEVIFIAHEVWVPVVRLEGRLCVFPGIPSLFQRMLTGLTPFLPLPPKSERPLRIQIFTERPESYIAPYLSSLQERFQKRVQVGSYPVPGKGVFVSLIGGDPCGQRDDGKPIFLAEVASEVEKEIDGRVVSDEEIAEKKGEDSGRVQSKF